VSIPPWLAKARGWEPSATEGAPDDVLSHPLVRSALDTFEGRIVSIRDAVQKAARTQEPGWSMGRRRVPCPSCGAYPYTRPAGQEITRRCHGCGHEWNPEA
jgi:hypothetical protein